MVTLTDVRVAIRENLQALQGYASQVIREQRQMTYSESEDLARRAQEFFAAGKAVGLTERELVSLVLKPVLRPKPSCGCPRCRERLGA